MDFETLRRSLKKDQKEGNGKILGENEKGISYYDYDTSCDDDVLYFRKPEYCTKDELEKLIFVGNVADKRITPEFLANVLSDAYSGILDDMMAVLRGIAVISEDQDVKKLSEAWNIDEDEIRDVEPTNCIGVTWFQKRIAIIYEQAVIETSREIAKEDPSEPFGRIYLRGICSTAIHECRHVMLDCNPFLDEDEYPVYLQSEEEVEEFCRDRWDRIETKYQ